MFLLTQSEFITLNKAVAQLSIDAGDDVIIPSRDFIDLTGEIVESDSGFTRKNWALLRCEPNDAPECRGGLLTRNEGNDNTLIYTFNSPEIDEETTFVFQFAAF